MARNGEVKKQNGKVSEKTLRKSIEYQRIGNAAVRKAQEENRRLGVPNWYSINGVIVNEAELEDKNKSQK
ncbi:MAG: hypothetical protein H0V31_02410 [Acidobacteria bacterium]|jgi:hypothetical protein|nr:hypothetical protein [Acidobacteriota bacterium]